MLHRKKPGPKWTIWVQKPHSLRDSARNKESIEEALQSVYGLECSYLGFRWEYHQIPVYNGNKTQVHHAAQALLFLHHKWIRETVNPPWNGVCEVTITEGIEQPEWVMAIEHEREQSYRERSENEITQR